MADETTGVRITQRDIYEKLVELQAILLPNFIVTGKQIGRAHV